ncbi:MAG: DNA repair protein RecN [Bacteroidales bacterium]|nr:DNA repair protein RecN [Bacteroidales bacterium]
MLRSLHIRNYILIDSLDVTFPEGLVIITGQTGAGKSILLGALGLLAGGKADSSLISEGAESCVVEGEFETPQGLRIIRRVLYSSGRSRSFIDDCPAQVQELSELSETLFDIHSQHRSLLLTDSAFQLSLLDHFAGNEGLLEECTDTWRKLSGARKEYSDATEELKRNLAESDYNKAQFNELDAAHLKAGELQELEEEQQALANAEQIREDLSLALDCFSPSGRTGVAESLKEARRAIEHAGRFLPGMQELEDRIESARIELEDVFSEVESNAERIDVSGERLEQVEERLSLLYRLMHKHGCSDIEGLMEIKEHYSQAVSGTEELDERCQAISRRIAELEASYESLSARLHDARSHAAPLFAEQVEGHLHFLELERSSFNVELQPAEASAGGKDAVRFLFSSDGSRPTDVAKCASGGEISRIMLSLKAIMAKFKGMPTLIFDEIDSGVSGSVADKMGKMICEMGQTMQVFSITHLPQVAAKGSAHYMVSKQFNPATGRSSTGIKLLQGTDRVNEIARLLSGESITPEAVANAKALMNEN